MATFANDVGVNSPLELSIGAKMTAMASFNHYMRVYSIAIKGYSGACAVRYTGNRSPYYP